MYDKIIPKKKGGIFMDAIDLRSAIEYFNYIKDTKLSLSLKEISTSQGIDNYLKLIDELLVNASSLHDVKEKHLNITRVNDLASQILNLIFYSSELENKIHEMISKIVVTGGNSYDGSVILVRGKKYITVGSNDKVLSIPTITHEATHIIVPEKSIQNAHLIDTIPILIELITSVILDGMHIGENNFNQVLIVRIASLREEFINKVENLRNIKTEEEQFISAYFRHSFYNYLISFVYALNLLIYYLEDTPRFITHLKNVLNDKNIYELISDYGIDFLSDDTINNVIKVLKNTP